MKNTVINILSSIRGSYGMVFFSNNTALAVCLLLASFIEPCVGISGLVSLVFTLFLAHFFGLNPAYIQNGTYSFNSLLTGFALGACFKLSGNFFLVVLMASAVTLFITSWFAVRAERFKIPFLSLPFIFSTWIILLNAHTFGNNILIVRTALPCAGFWGEPFNALSANIDMHLPKYLAMYFKAMAAIFFQGHLLAGMLVAIGLLLHSRIACLLSLTGFFSGLIYFKLLHGHMNDAEYTMVSFNYILVALGLGGYFLISSGASFLLVIFTTPLVGLFAMALGGVIVPYALPIYSLPFSVVLILIVSLLNNRYVYKYFHPVYFQQFSPEKNLYAYHSFMERFHTNTDVAIHLPFYGEWTVSQGHNGNITHKSDWRFAWDFVVTDEHKRTFKFPGKSLADFYCYGLPVLSPADGLVVAIEDGIADNDIGDVNLAQNWGNTIIIKHSETLYSKLSHLKKESFKVKVGDALKKGDVLAACGNSGRSPEPHIHFQLQNSECIGAATLNFPVSNYITKKQDGYALNIFDTPKEGDILSRPTESQLLKKPFHLVPGMKLAFEINDNKTLRTEHWEVLTDAFNNTYIQCTETKAIAYFICSDLLFYFTEFKGDQKSLLYYFYLGAYKVLLSHIKDLRIHDKLSVEGSRLGILKVIQDIVAPFYIFIKPTYASTLTEPIDKDDKVLRIISEVKNGLGRKIIIETDLFENKIQEIKITQNNKCITAKHIQ